MYKKFKPVEGAEKRIRLAGLCYIHLLGYNTPREYCRQTILGMADLDDDEMLFYSNDIGKDYEHIEEKVDQPFSGFWDMVVKAYVVPEQIDRAMPFMQVETLREAFETGKVTDSIDYLCVAGGEDMWIRAVYELELNDEGHLIVSFALINVHKSKTEGLDEV